MLLAAAATSGAACVSPPPAEAAGVDLGLRRSGRSAKFNNVPREAYTKLPSGVMIYDVVDGNGAIVDKGARAVSSLLHSAQSFIGPADALLPPRLCTTIAGFRASG